MDRRSLRELEETFEAAALLVAIAAPGPIQDAWLAALREYPEGPSFPERLRRLAAEPPPPTAAGR